MIKLVDNFLNGITMYRLMLYYLIVLFTIAVIYSVLGVLSFSPLSLLFSVIFLLAVGYATNAIFARVLKVVTNVESVYISVLILVLILTPPKTFQDLVLLFLAAVCTMAGKYIFAFQKKHIFNPVALGVFLPAIFFGSIATWWIGNPPMLIPVLIGGLLIARKIQRFQMTLLFLIVSVVTVLALDFFQGRDILAVVPKIFSLSPILFFAFVMFIEPMTTPPTRNWRSLYAVLAGILFAPQVHVGDFYSTPEAALLIANLFSYAVSSKEKLILTLSRKISLSPDIYDFVFQSQGKFNFTPGQYLEWTLGHNRSDSRGNRRFFTLSSSPTEDTIRIGVKFPERPSSFKVKLSTLSSGDTIAAGNLAGDFTMPRETDKKLAFLAGGIGVTPFRSMVKYLLDSGQKRDVIILYFAKNDSEFVYQDIFSRAFKKLGIKTVYKVGRLERKDILDSIPDYQERLFYLSGPHAMVTSYEELLADLKVKAVNIKVDYFPGYA